MLTRVIEAHKDTIQTTTKGPLYIKTIERGLDGLIAEDEQKVDMETACVINIVLFIDERCV